MAVSIAIDLSFLDAQPTGVGNYALNLSRALRALDPPGHELLAWNGYRTRPLGAFLDAWDAASTISKDLSQHRRARLRRSPLGHTAARWVRARLAPRFECFHALNFVPGFPVRGRVIPTVHDLSFLRYPHYSPAERVSGLMGARQVIQAAPAVHVISDFTKGEVTELLGVPAQNIFVIPPAAAPVGPPDRELPFDLRPDGFILYVGSQEPRKNLTTLVSAYLALTQEQRAEYPLVLAGPTGWTDFNLPAATQSAVARGEIRLVGYLPESTIRQLMRAARVFVYPSIYEGFGMPVLEALAEGTPVIISKDAGLGEASCGLGTAVRATDVFAWRQAIEDALATESAPAARRQRSETAGQRYSWTKSALATLEMYDVLAARRE